MAVSLHWLMRRPDLDLKWVGGIHAPDRPIVWAHPIELLDPTPWLRIGELILTTGLRMPRSEAGQRAYVQRLAKAGAAGLGFGLGLSHREVPAGIRNAADEFSFPVLEVPFGLPFIAITQCIAQALAHEQTQALRRVLDEQQRLTRAAISGRHEAVVRRLSSALDADVVLLSHRAETVAHWPENTAALQRYTRDTMAKIGFPRAAFSMSDFDSDRHHVAESVGKGNSMKVLAVARAQELTKYDRLLVNQAASLLAMPMDTLHQRTQPSHDVRRALYACMASSQTRSPELLQVVRSVIGLAPHALVTVRVILFQTVSEAHISALAVRLSNEDIPFVMGGESDCAIVLVAGDPVDQSDFVTALIVEEAGPGTAIGESRPITLETLPTAVIEADYAARVARSRNSTVLRFNEIGVQAMLLSGQSDEQLRALAASVLRPVLDLGDPLAQRLLSALSAFLHNNGHWGEAAASAGIHRHTLRKQVQQVEELTRRSVSDANERSDLFLATMALELSSLRVKRAARVRRSPGGTPGSSSS